MTYRDQPHWIVVRWHARCAKCDATLHRGEQAFYYPATKKAYGEPCLHAYDAELDYAQMTHNEDVISGRC